MLCYLVVYTAALLQKSTAAQQVKFACIKLRFLCSCVVDGFSPFKVLDTNLLCMHIFYFSFFVLILISISYVFLFKLAQR